MKMMMDYCIGRHNYPIHRDSMLIGYESEAGVVGVDDGLVVVVVVVA